MDSRLLIYLRFTNNFPELATTWFSVPYLYCNETEGYFDKNLYPYSQKDLGALCGT